MADNLTQSQRSYTMSRIRNSRTSPEIKARATLKILGFAYQPEGIYGRPDFANKKRKIALFIDGCFWHGCKKHYTKPKTNIHYWNAKIKHNIKRDKQVNRVLKLRGWHVIRIWEHYLRKNNNEIIKKLVNI